MTGGASAPFFIVGCPRSGTTLLKAMLDGHPRLALPHESHFVLGLAPSWWRRRRATVDDVLAHPWFRAWDLDPALVRRAVEERRPATWPALVDAVFTAYAADRGKVRWGDRTPGFVSHIPRVAAMFPDASVVHVLRDGREVAASLAERSWGPDHIVTGAFWWRDKVRAGRRDGPRCFAGRYLEVRLEDLVAAPEDVLRRVCDFLGEPYDPGLLEYPARIRADMPTPGRAVQHLGKPPTPGLRDWRTGTTAADQRAVEAVCRPLLEELGYEVTPTGWAPLARAWAIRIRSLLRTGPAAAWARLRPATRDY